MNYHELRGKPTVLGYVSVDMLTLPSPVIVVQMTVNLIKARYMYVTVFVDQYSFYTYVYPQTLQTAKETLKANQAFELDAQKHGIQIKNYHSDNEVFRAHKWVNACHRKQKLITFAAVNAHFKNGIAEQKS